MKRWIYFLGHLAIITILTSFATFTVGPKAVEVPLDLKVEEGLISWVEYHKSQSNHLTPSFESVFLGKSFVGFKEALAFKESQGKYSSVNTLGYLGKYQFGANTLKLMGVHDTQLFLENPVLQEKLFELNVARNKWILRRDIKRFVGKKINGVLITESGIVAAAHLAGAGNVKKYLRSYGQTDFSDAYGSTVAYYIKKFGGYDVSPIKAIHNPKVNS
ncbi:MAG: hypothetical protein AAGC45_01590 [Bacteroidota bacterium]